MEIGEILNELKNDPIYVESVSNGIDVEKTVLENIDKWKKYKSINTVVTFAKSELTRKIQSKNDTVVNGISIGQSDVFGIGIPTTFPVLVPDGNHIGVVHYDVNKIPEPSRVELKVRHNTKFNNFMITEVIKAEPIDKKTLIERLLRVARGASDIDFNSLRKNQIIVIKGIINWVNPAKTFQDGKVVGNKEVYLSTEDAQKRFVPVIDISLQKENNNTVVFQLIRQRFGKPIYDVIDLDTICQSAVSETPDPIEQAKIVKSGISGRNVVGVGEIIGMKAGTKGNFINLRTFALFEYDPSSFPSSKTSLGDGQTKLVDESSKKNVSSDKPPAKVENLPPQEKIETQKVQSQPKTSPSRGGLIKEYGEKIRRLSQLCEQGAGSFKVDELRRTLKIPEDIPDAIIDEAISYAILPPREE